jgi:dTDP-4-dehydrorhamnose 3,5-epimerase-like enzyme
MPIRKLQSYAHFNDKRGTFLGLTNQGRWAEINFVRTHQGASRGNNYRKEAIEVVYLIKGEIEVEGYDVGHPDSRTVFRISSGEGVEISPYSYHELRYLTDCEQVTLLDVPFNSAQPDTYQP